MPEFNIKKNGGCFLLSAAIFVFTGCDRLPFFSGKDAAVESPAVVSEEKDRGLEALSAEVQTPNERRRINRLFLREMYEQVYARRLADLEFYNSWMNVLEQGASIEGVYRGLVLSDRYRDLERGVASKDVREFFARETGYLEHLKNSKLRAEDVAREVGTATEKASLFTLKRVLGEQVLAAIELRKTDREAMAQLYADLVMRWFVDGVDFGHKQRNIQEREYHLEWARKSSRGRIQWEILNRLHRSMNHLGRILYAR